MALDWGHLMGTRANRLLLNPRLAAADRERFERAWRELVDGQSAAHFAGRFEGQVGIATSGTSGDGSGRLVLLSQEALLASARAVNSHLRANRDDIWFKTLPEFHVGGLGIIVRAHLSGSRFVESTLEKWDARAFHTELERAKATLLSLVPTQLHDLVTSGLRAPPALRAVVLGGARLSHELYRRARELGWPALPSYGMTEVCSQVATAPLESLEGSPEHEPRLKLLEHVRVRIQADASVSQRPAGTVHAVTEPVGAIVISSPALLTGYIAFSGRDAAGAEAMYRDPKSTDSRDGSLWLRTEDRGRIEGDGSLTVLGRTIDFVKIGGEGVLLSRLEETLSRLKLERGIAYEAEIFAAADERLGAQIVLISAAPDNESGANEVRALIDSFNARVMPYERIRSAHRLAKLPRSPLGKLLRFEALGAVGLKPIPNL